mmetsp:Transcript_53175/g.94928  ORF Transcript_53175/g.94928 Transcript_53175/m.94928 type:complete len:220 (+) Transcript_53175:15580-16239(+)
MNTIRSNALLRLSTVPFSVNAVPGWVPQTSTFSVVFSCTWPPPSTVMKTSRRPSLVSRSMSATTALNIALMPSETARKDGATTLGPSFAGAMVSSTSRYTLQHDPPGLFAGDCPSSETTMVMFTAWSKSATGVQPMPFRAVLRAEMVPRMRRDAAGWGPSTATPVRVDKANVPEPTVMFMRSVVASTSFTLMAPNPEKKWVVSSGTLTRVGADKVGWSL